MKKFKKLIPAFCMLLVSAIMLGSSTFAWFSMNDRVTATGMQVTAKANTTYLVILNDSSAFTGAGITTAPENNSTTAQAPTNTKLFPAAFFKTVDDETTMGDNNVNLVAAGVAAGSDIWVTANNGNRDNATDAVANVMKITETDLSKYTAEYKVWLTLVKGSEKANKKIKITDKSATAAGEAKAVVKINSEWVDIYNGEGTTTRTVEITDAAVVAVSIYVYIDGNNSNVKSVTNIADIAGTISLEFTLVD